MYSTDLSKYTHNDNKSNKKSEELYVVANFMDEILNNMKEHIHDIQRKKKKNYKKSTESLQSNNQNQNNLNLPEHSKNQIKINSVTNNLTQNKFAESQKKLQTIHENLALDMDNSEMIMTPAMHSISSPLKLRNKLSNNVQGNIKAVEAFVHNKNKTKSIKTIKTKNSSSDLISPKKNRKIINKKKSTISTTNKQKKPAEPRKSKTQLSSLKKIVMNSTASHCKTTKSEKRIPVKTSIPKTPDISKNNKPGSSINSKRTISVEHSKQIRNIVNQITTNLKQHSSLRNKNFNIKREVYINGYSPNIIATNKAITRIEQNLGRIGTILKPDKSTKKKGSTLLNKEIINTKPAIEEKDKVKEKKIPREEPKPPIPKTSSKEDISKKINDIIKVKKEELVQQIITEIQHMKNEPSKSELIKPENNEEINENTDQFKITDDEIIKKINEKIEEIIVKGLKSNVYDSNFSSSSTSTTASNIIQNSKFINAIKIKESIDNTQKEQSAPIASSASNREPPRFMRAQPVVKDDNKTLNSTPLKPLPDTNNIQSITIVEKIVNNLPSLNPVTGNNTISDSVSRKHEANTTTKKSGPPVTPVPQPQQIEKIVPPATDTHSTIKSNVVSNASVPRKISITIANPVTQLTNKLIPSHTISKSSTIHASKPIISSFHATNPTIVQTVSPIPKTSTNTLNMLAALSPSKKFGLLTPMEVVQDFVNLVNNAKKNRKTYTICGNFYSLRRALTERGWVEKMRINIMDERETWKKIETLSNFELVDGMRDKDHGEKYRRVFLTKLLAGHQVDFYWDYLTNPFTINNDRVKRTLINRFPFGATRSYTTKHGLCESLKDSYWYCIDGYANIFYPRTYNLALNDEMGTFIEDFRITAVISLLKWIVDNVETPQKIIAADGIIPTSVYNFATIQCHNFIKIKEHKDIDEIIPQAKEYEWDVFLEKYYKIVHNEELFRLNDRITPELMIEQARYVLKKVRKYLPYVNTDGFKNMWLLKPNNGSRGSGIHVCRTLKYMVDTVNSRKDVKYVVQKYIERPLLIHRTKFDIRQWFLVTCMPNLKVWMYKECYLRFSSQFFDLNKLHESIHLTNNSIQCRYKNNIQRSNNLPEYNMWDSETFRKFLTDNGQPYTWRNIIYKGMKECLISLFMLCQDKMEMRINSFELCGADFMLDEEYHPYLIEINSRPALYPSTKITSKMCPKVLEDLIKVIIDNSRNPKASTGDFELIYTDTFNYSVIPNKVNNLFIEGISYFSKYTEQKAIDMQPPSKKSSPFTIEDTKEQNLKKILNIDPTKVKKDVKNTLEKILAAVHGEETVEGVGTVDKNKQFKSMLSEFVNIISTVKKPKEETN